MKNIHLLKKREEEIREVLLHSVDVLIKTRKAFKEASSVFTSLCEEKLRVQTALFELEGKITRVPRPSIHTPYSSETQASSKKSSEKRKLSVKKEWDEVQALLAQHGLSRK